MRLPKSFKEVTVDQYQRISPIYQKITEERLKQKDLKDLELIESIICIRGNWCRIISILTGVAPHILEGMESGKVTDLIKALSWMEEGVKARRRKYLLIKGKLYKARKEAKRFSYGEYTDIKSFLAQGDWIGEMHKILATIYHPLTIKGFHYKAESHEQRSKLFKEMSVEKVYPTVFFYSIQYRNLIRRIQLSGLKLAQQKNREAQEALMLILKETLESIGAGTVHSTN